MTCFSSLTTQEEEAFQASTPSRMLTHGQTQAAMEEKTIANVRSALETGLLRDIIPEHAGS
jgi:hypothetical protein